MKKNLFFSSILSLFLIFSIQTVAQAAQITSVTTNNPTYTSGDSAVVSWSSSGIDSNDFCIWLYKGSVEKEHHCTGEPLTPQEIRSPYTWPLSVDLVTGSDYRFKVCQHGLYGCESEGNPSITVYSLNFTVNKIIGTQTCSQKSGTCCASGQTCSSGKKDGASDCAECCGSISNCSGGGSPPGPGGSVEIQNPIQAGSFEDIINSIINFIFKIAVILAPLMVIVSGFLFVTSAGDPKKITQAKSILIYAAVGLLIVLLSKGILAIIKQILGTT